MNYFGGVRFFFWAFQSSIPEVWLSISMAFPVCWSFLQSSERLRLWEPVIWCEVEDFSGLAAWRPLVILARFGRCFLERTEVTMGVFFFNNLSIYLSICLSIYLSIHPSIYSYIFVFVLPQFGICWRFQRRYFSHLINWGNFRHRDKPHQSSHPLASQDKALDPQARERWDDHWINLDLAGSSMGKAFQLVSRCPTGIPIHFIYGF